MSTNEKFLPYGNNNDLVIANSQGDVIRSGYSIITEEKYITEKDKSKKFIPNAQTVAKAINAAIESAQEKVALVNEFITQITPVDSCADIVVAKENGFDGVELTAQNLEEALKVCRGLGIKPYINIQTENEFASVINLVKKYNLLANTTFVSTDYNILNVIKNQYPTNGLLYKIAGFVAGDRIYDVIVNNLLNLQTGKNKVTVAVNAPDCQVNSYFINDFVEICINNDIELCSWAKTTTSDTGVYILNTHPYVSTFINSKFIPEKVLYTHFSELYK